MNHPIEIVDLEDEDEEFFFTPLLQSGSTKDTAISVDHYTEDRDLQLAIVASLRKPTTTNKVKNNFIHLDDYNDDFDDLHVLNFEPQNTPFSKKRKSFPNSSVTETGQSSNSKNDDLDLSFICEICVEPKSATDTFNIKGCDHAYCTVCMAKYVASKLQQNITCIPCPAANCTGLLEPEYCRNILPQDVFDRWGNALCEAVIPVAQKFYCPYKDCSALLIDDGVEVIKESECPNCRRMFCAQCKAPWHAGIECSEFQKLNKDERENEDIMLMNLAQEKKWKRCPHCKYYVEKKSGCMYMKCRCGNAFCYNCRALSNSTSHMCPKCNH